MDRRRKEKLVKPAAVPHAPKPVNIPSLKLEQIQQQTTTTTATSVSVIKSEETVKNWAECDLELMDFSLKPFQKDERKREDPSKLSYAALVVSNERTEKLVERIEFVVEKEFTPVYRISLQDLEYARQFYGLNRNARDLEEIQKEQNTQPVFKISLKELSETKNQIDLIATFLNLK